MSKRKTVKDIIINVSSGETRIAILEDQAMVELYVERPESERMVGDIYKGVVTNTVEAIRAGFVNIGLKQNGFLPFDEVGKELISFSERVEETEKTSRGRSKGKGRRTGRRRLRTGQDILVQITKEPLGTKGARLTSDVSLPGRLLVLVPGDNSVGVSKKIADAKERRRLRMLARSLRPDGFGLIIRTVAVGKDTQAIRSDLEGLMKTWRKMEEKIKREKTPALIHKEMGLASSVIRDLFSPDINRLVVDSRKLYGEISRYLKEVSPNLLSKLELYKGRTPIFDEYKIEDEIEKSLSRKLWLKSGGHLIFDHTEAMVVVDVNSGRSVGERDHEKNALKTDLEAARMIARQLRLRDVGGIIVIDFIDLLEEKNRKRVLSELKRELRKDRAAFDILPMNDFGLVSLTRERVRPSLLFQYSEECPRCGGLGRVPSKSSIVTKLERRVQQIKSKSGERRMVLTIHPEMAAYLKEGFRSRLNHLMVKHFVRIRIVMDGTLRDEEFKLVPAKEYKTV